MFVGRDDLIRQLDDLWRKRTASLVTCRGRRRIGKSTLIERFADKSADHFIEIVGLAPRKGMTDRRQLANFSEGLARFSGKSITAARTWPQAFDQLDEVIPAKGKTVVLLDEISWMGCRNPDFAGFLKTAWDTRLKKHDKLVVVVCGSVSSWIAENILNSTGFVGRNSLDLEVKELPIRDCMSVIGPRAERLSVREKLDILSVVGGVPRYLEEFKTEYSVEENIRRMCFTPEGLLFREYEETFSSVFGNRMKTRERLLRSISDGSHSAAELSEKIGIPANGKLSCALRDLEYAGFAERTVGVNPATGADIREERYRVKDNYARFYLHYIEPRRRAIARGLFKFSSLEQMKGWETDLGFQFENLILNHVTDLFPLLGLESSLVLSASPYVQRGNSNHRGCQIDLLIQTQRSLFVVEIKRRKEIGIKIIDEVAEKVARLKRRKDLTVRTALVYAGELAKSVAAEDYFDFIVPAEELFEHR